MAPNAALTAIETGPFYAARIVLSDLGTKGGLVTDADARVLRRRRHRHRGPVRRRQHRARRSVAAFYPGPGVPLGTAMVVLVPRRPGHGEVTSTTRSWGRQCQNHLPHTLSHGVAMLYHSASMPGKPSTLFAFFSAR